MARKNKQSNNVPKCVFCGASHGAQFVMFGPRFAPFGTACVKCEESLPAGTKVPTAGEILARETFHAEMKSEIAENEVAEILTLK